MKDSMIWPRMANDSVSLDTETKYVAPAYRTIAALSMLNRCCDPDPKFPFGIVSSIYYDTRNWDYLRQKRNSDYLKLKVRLRWYGQLDSTKNTTNVAFAEAKFRIGSKRMKIRLPTDFEGADISTMVLHDRVLLGIPFSLAREGAPIQKALFPGFVVRYSRQRYIDRSSGARICIDYDISSPDSNILMLANTFPCTLKSTVLEIKGADGEFPLAVRNLLKLGFRRASFSKYYECYSRLTSTIF